MYELQGLSFREYLKLNQVHDFQIIKAETLWKSHVDFAADITQKIRPLAHFERYLKTGYYPFFLEGEAFYSDRLEKTIRLIIENDLDFIPGYDPRNARKIYQLFYILATNVPFKPNISKLSEKIGIHRNTLIQYFHHLEKARLIHTLYPAGISTSILQKPEKVFLHNTNISYAISPQLINKGSLRETFLLNQLKGNMSVSLPKKGDFLVDEQYTLEVGGTRKSKSQLVGLSNAFVVADGIEIGGKGRIPLWLFGFLY